LSPDQIVGTVLSAYLLNNLWIIIAALLVFLMTIAIGFLEVGEVGSRFESSFLKTITITATGLIVMAIIGFNTAFAPTISGIIGNPLYPAGLFLGSFSSYPSNLESGVWWSMTSSWFGTYLTTDAYYFFEAACASVTLALVAVILLNKVKFKAFFIYSIVYFIIIWNLPAAWIWNPSGWLYELGMRDFAGGLVVHAAAGAAGLGILYQIWREEKRRGLKTSPRVGIKVSEGWITLSILLLWVGWFGFDPGSGLAFNGDVPVVAVTTFVAAASAFVSTMLFKYIATGKNPGTLYAVNGILMGLIIITPLAGFVSPGSAFILGILGGPIFLAGDKYLSRVKWFTDPIGLLPEHFVGGIFGVAMIAFFTQNSYAAASGNSSLPSGLLFGGGMHAVGQLGLELLGVAVVLVVVFIISFVTMWVISLALKGITTSGSSEEIVSVNTPVYNVANSK